MLEFILMILVVELGIGLYLYSKAHAPERIEPLVTDDTGMWFEDIPNRLKAKRVTNAKKATTSKKPAKGYKIAPVKVWANGKKATGLQGSDKSLVEAYKEAKPTNNKQTKKGSRQVAQPSSKATIRRKR